MQAIEVSFGPLDDMLYGRRWLQDFTFDHASGDVVVPWFPLECLECSERRTRDADVYVSGNGGGSVLGLAMGAGLMMMPQGRKMKRMLDKGSAQLKRQMKEMWER